jgi:hypothetical protein
MNVRLSLPLLVLSVLSFSAAATALIVCQGHLLRGAVL